MCVYVYAIYYAFQFKGFRRVLYDSNNNNNNNYHMNACRPSRGTDRFVCAAHVRDYCTSENWSRAPPPVNWLRRRRHADRKGAATEPRFMRVSDDFAAGAQRYVFPESRAHCDATVAVLFVRFRCVSVRRRAWWGFVSSNEGRGGGLDRVKGSPRSPRTTTGECIYIFRRQPFVFFLLFLVVK